MPDENGYPTYEEYLAVLKQYQTPSIAQIFKVSEAAVEDWKAGQNDFSGQYGISRRRIVELLFEKGVPVA